MKLNLLRTKQKQVIIIEKMAATRKTIRAPSGHFTAASSDFFVSLSICFADVDADPRLHSASPGWLLYAGVYLR